MKRIEPGPGQESVWDYPRPPRLEATAKLVQVLFNGEQIAERLEFDEDTAGEVMSNKFVVVLDEWDVGTATRAIRRKAADIEKFYEVYVVNEERELVGRLKLRDLLLHKSKVIIRDIMREVSVTVTAVNDSPMAITDMYTTTNDTLLTVPVAGVLSNDTDPDSSINAVLNSLPINGSLLTFNF